MGAQTNRTSIYQQVIDEQVRQEKKWGVQNHEPDHWFLILGEEFGEAAKEALEAKTAKTPIEGMAHLIKYREELIQVAAVTISMIECLDRNADKL